VTESEAFLIGVQFRAARAAGITLPLEGSETISARQLEVYNDVLLREVGALLENKEDICSPKR
jgi:hypothetical protein